MLDMYGEVAAGLKACLQHMGPWSPGDLVLGLRHVMSRHDSHDIADNIPGQPVSRSASPQVFQYLHRECTLACAAYSIPDVGKITSEAEIDGNSDIIHVHEATARFKPAFFVMKDAEAKLFRVVVRGTNDLNDVLTDIAGHWEPFDSGFAHSGVLQSAEWLLEQTVPLLRDVPFQESEPFGLRFSGHSLGAGTAALATHILHTQPQRFPSLLSTFPRSRIDCFCAAPPPVLSLSLARSSADYITSLVLGHDIVARASIANFEQLRLEVLTSGWWEELTNPVLKSTTFQKVQDGLERAGAKELVELARSAGQAFAERRAAAGDAAAPPTVIESALERLHDVYTMPTTQRSASAHSASSSHVGAVIESLLVSSRESTRGATEALLDRVSVISKKSPQELSSLAVTAAAAAAAAWKAAAAHATAAAPAPHAAGAGGSRPCKSQQLPGGPAAAAQRTVSAKESEVTRSWLSGFMTGSFAACSAVCTVVADASKEPDTGGAKSQRSMSASGSAGGHSKRTRAPGNGDKLAVGAAASAASEVAKLDKSITAERLYAPGRLLHLRREPPEARQCGAVPTAVATPSDSVPAGDAALQLEDVVLVDGDPMDARFEFIAVRSTWLSDHSLVAMLRALEAAERRD